jgi:SAM-dependent methyltransferase
MKHLPLVCPCKDNSSLIKENNLYICTKTDCEHSNRKNGFASSGLTPILISESRTDTVCFNHNDHTYIKRSELKMSFFKKFINDKSRVTEDNCKIFINKLLKLSKKPKVLIIGGAEKGKGTKDLWKNSHLEIHTVDIYKSEIVDIICDAHYLPLESNFYDGVWIQAVLEHVVEPNVVVEEIYRVLKKHGIVYAETPFMQHVHEGAYDFTRFTVLGHRYLFKKFKLHDIGGNKGPELVLAWSIKYFIWGIFRSRQLARIFGIFSNFLLRPFAFLIGKSSLYDASSSVYFLGEKLDSHHISHKELIKLYKGNIK